MNDGKIHICVCICTYQRPQLLENLIDTLLRQKTEGRFTYSIVIVDNDKELSAKEVATGFRRSPGVIVEYHTEPRKSFALARTMAVKKSRGDFIAFIDDDEVPLDDWLLNLCKSSHQYKADVVLGPVKPHYETAPPAWLLKGGFCERPVYATGTALHWRQTRSGNVLLNRRIIEEREDIFDPKFNTGGEDVSFFKELSEKGHTFIWCNEAPVYELVPAERCTKSYFLKRALLQGSICAKYYQAQGNFRQQLLYFVKSSIACVIYTLMLPVVVFLGTPVLMKYLTMNVYHLSRLLALSGIQIAKERKF